MSFLLTILIRKLNVIQYITYFISPSFSFYEINDGKIISEKNIESPGHGHGILPEFIASYGAKVVIAGGMGQGAVHGCASYGIQVVTGVEGDADMAVELYAKGELSPKIETCSCHGHSHSHNEGHSCSSGKCNH